jgi:hypothetical protein
VCIIFASIPLHYMFVIIDLFFGKFQPSVIALTLPASGLLLVKKEGGLQDVRKAVRMNSHPSFSLAYVICFNKHHLILYILLCSTITY